MQEQGNGVEHRVGAESEVCGGDAGNFLWHHSRSVLVLGLLQLALHLTFELVWVGEKRQKTLENSTSKQTRNVKILTNC